MPKYNENIIGQGYFEIDDIPYSKIHHDVSISGDKVGFYKKNTQYASSFIFFPLIYSEWTNASGTPYASLSAFLDDLKGNFFFDSSSDFGLASFKVNYYEIIDISATTIGSLQETPTGAIVQEGEFGESGNAVLSTLNAEGKPSFESPLDGGSQPITASLDVNGDWVTSDNYVDPVAIIYTFIISGANWDNVDVTKVVDFYDANPNTLEEVTTKGNTTTKDIIHDQSKVIFRDDLGDQVGRVSQAIQSPDFGLAVVSETSDTLRNKRLSLAGSEVFLATGTLEMVFNGAENGNILKIVSKKDVLGNDVFVAVSQPFDGTDTEQLFSSISDVPITITPNYTTTINGIANRDYSQDTAFGDSSFYVENTSSTVATIEVGLAINATDPPQTQIFIVPKKKGGVNGVARIFAHDTFTTNIPNGSDIHSRVREVTNTGALTVRGSIETTFLRLEQTAVLKNSVQTLRALASPAPSTNLEVKTSYSLEVGSGAVFVLPQASLVYNENNPVEVEVNNVSGTQKIIDSAGADSIYRSGGETNLLGISDGESFVFRCINTTTWKIIRSYQNDRSDRIVALGTFSTNANFDSNPQTLLTDTVNYGFSLAKISISFESANTATNRRTVVGLYIDGALIDDVSDIEPKDTNNNYYQSKVFDYIFTSGDHDIEVIYGRRGGGGGSLAQVSNVRIYIEELKLIG